MRVRAVVLTIGLVVCFASIASAQEPSHEEPPPPLPTFTPPPTKTTITVTQSSSGAPVADRPTPPQSPSESLAEQKLLTGFRLGYLYVFEHQKKLEGLGGQSLADRTGMRSPHQFLIGYEAFYRMLGHSSMNVLLVANAMVSGLEQSKFYPSANGLIGFEFSNSFQLGVGVNVTPLKGNEAHTIVAAGWTPRSGSFYVPIHAFFVPDVDGAHRVGVTTGVTF